MSYQNKNRSEKKDIPVMSKDEIASLYATRAESLNAIQLFRADGTPLVGAVFADSPIGNKHKMYRGKKVECNLLCCNGRSNPVKPYAFIKPDDYSNPDQTAPQPDQWVNIEKRSVRRLKTRIKFAKEGNDYMRPNVLYAMSDD